MLEIRIMVTRTQISKAFYTATLEAFCLAETIKKKNVIEPSSMSVQYREIQNH